MSVVVVVGESVDQLVAGTGGRFARAAAGTSIEQISPVPSPRPKISAFIVDQVDHAAEAALDADRASG